MIYNNLLHSSLPHALPYSCIRSIKYFSSLFHLQGRTLFITKLTLKENLLSNLYVDILVEVVGNEIRI